MDAWLEEMRDSQNEMMACHEAMEAYPEKMKANPKEMESVAEHQDVPNEEAAVETIVALQDRYGNWCLAAGCRQQLKKWAQGDGGSRQKLAAARVQLTHCAIPAPRKGHGH
jgi:hypothetical protein